MPMALDELVFFPNINSVLQVTIRIVVAGILGGIIGYEREVKGKAAGLRTHMLLAMGTVIVLVVARLDGIPMSEMSKVIEGLVTGVGFLGGGAILKLSDKQEIRGVTTAASIWSTSAIGIAVGLGQIWIGILSTIVVWIILFVVGYLEKRVWNLNKDRA